MHIAAAWVLLAVPPVQPVPVPPPAPPPDSAVPIPPDATPAFDPHGRGTAQGQRGSRSDGPGLVEFFRQRVLRAGDEAARQGPDPPAGRRRLRPPRGRIDSAVRHRSAGQTAAAGGPVRPGRRGRAPGAGVSAADRRGGRLGVHRRRDPRAGPAEAGRRGRGAAGLPAGRRRRGAGGAGAAGPGRPGGARRQGRPRPGAGAGRRVGRSSAGRRRSPWPAAGRRTSCPPCASSCRTPTRWSATGPAWPWRRRTTGPPCRR